VQVETAAKDRLVFLDIARGIAALLVVVSHGLNAWIPGYMDWSAGRINLGSIGVHLFFVITGFIIPASLCRNGSLSRFWLRRFFRLFPLYWTVIAVCWLSTLTGHPTGQVTLDRPWAWIANLGMVQSFTGQRHVLAIFWTLTWELMIYGACSVLYLLGLLRRPHLVIWMMVLSAYVAGGIWRPLAEGERFVVGGRMFYVLGPFFGAAFEAYHSGRLSRRGLTRLVMCFYLAIAAMLVVNGLICPEPATQAGELWRFFGHWFFAFTGFAILYATRHRLSHGFFSWCGRISYSAYLWHAIVVEALVLSGCPNWLYLPALVIGTLAISAISYRFIESPGIALGRVLESRLFASPNPSKIKIKETSGIWLRRIRVRADVPSMEAGHASGAIDCCDDVALRRISQFGVGGRTAAALPDHNPQI
jgi:peptidoglycan/LPS O-acetylase OafA/YrhL